AAALRRETAECVRHGIRLSVIGRRDRLPATLVEGIVRAERQTAGGTRLHLRVAVDYSARAMIAEAARNVEGTGDPGDAFARALARAQHDAQPVPPVDLLIRSGGDQRLSDFLLWECAYAELYFSPILWPDFGAADLARAVESFRHRERRFGQIPLPASA
ncbi:MAG: polyprenyl diphosphate synthase, partial [Gemmatimonadota bacterium]|nr:polyprenyl diphosphate synthase [Gemmatimonadota bacterium]